MTDFTRSAKSRRGTSAGLLFALAAVAGLIMLAGAVVALVMWPRWPVAIAPDAPSVPVTVGGVLFNVPPPRSACRCSARPARRRGSISRSCGRR